MVYDMNPFVSVIIPVYNDCKRLKVCLERLDSQTYPKELYEIIVINNGGNQGIEGLVSRFNQVMLTQEAFPTPSAARNKGISLAKGEILAFTDSDCIPAEDWIEKGVKYIKNTDNCGLVGGKIELFYRDPLNLTMCELFEKVFAFDQKRFIDRFKFGATANVLTKKEIVREIGGFRPSLKMADDNVLGSMIFLSGYKQVYADDVIVAHPAKYSLRELCIKTIRIIGGLHDLKKEIGSLALSKIPGYRNPEVPFRLYTIFFGKDIGGFRERIKLTIAFLFVEAISYYERIRLHLGGNSRAWRDFRHQEAAT